MIKLHGKRYYFWLFLYLAFFNIFQNIMICMTKVEVTYAYGMLPFLLFIWLGVLLISNKY